MPGFDLRPEFAEFRATVRAFCREALPADIAAKVRAHRWLEKSERVRWQQILHARGWAAGHWPQAWGGLDWSPLQRFVFNEELERAGAPWLTPFGINYVGPILLAHGSEAQRARHLPPILRSELWWCQGYSEPGAGSDLAALATRAERRGDHYLVNGQKTWTTMAHWADWMFCLVRTAECAKPQQGISLLLVDLRSPGITIRPIPTIDECHHLNEVFFEDVAVPVENLVGTEGGAWHYTKVFLTHERLLATELGKADRLLADLAVERTREHLQTRRQFGRPLAAQLVLQHRLVDMHMAVLETSALVTATAAAYDAGAADLDRRLLILRAHSARAVRFVTQQAIQLHGGLGLCAEIAVGHYYRRALALDSLCGTADWALSRLAATEAS